MVGRAVAIGRSSGGGGIGSGARVTPGAPGSVASGSGALVAGSGTLVARCTGTFTGTLTGGAGSSGAGTGAPFPGPQAHTSATTATKTRPTCPPSTRFVRRSLLCKFRALCRMHRAV